MDIEYNEYINFIKSYHANVGCCGYYFKTENDCLKCMEKLKEKYSDRLIYLTLIEYTNEAKNEPSTFLNVWGDHNFMNILQISIMLFLSLKIYMIKWRHSHLYY